MIIDVDIFRRFINKSSLSGSIKTMYIDFLNDGMHCRVFDENKVCMTETKYNVDIDNIDDMESRVFIKNTDKLLKILKTFKGNVEITTPEPYIMSIKSEDNNREVDIILGSDIVCDNIAEKEMPTIPSVLKTPISRDFLNKVIVDLELEKATCVDIVVNDNKLYFSIGEKNSSDLLSNSMDVSYSDGIRVSIGEYLKSLYNAVDNGSELDIELGSDVPVIVRERGDMIVYSCMIAPIVKD